MKQMSAPDDPAMKPYLGSVVLSAIHCLSLLPFVEAAQAESESTLVGAVIATQQHTCLATDNTKLKSGDALAVYTFTPELTSAAILQAKVKKSGCGITGEAAARFGYMEHKKGLYELALSEPWQGTGIGLLRESIDPSKRAPDALDINSDGTPERLTACTTNEAISVSVVSEKGAKNPVKWEEYVYLGWDVEPTCPADDE